MQYAEFEEYGEKSKEKSIFHQISTKNFKIRFEQFESGHEGHRMGWCFIFLRNAPQE